MPFNAVYNKKRHLKLSVSVSFSGAGASTDSRIYIRFLGRVRCAFWFRLAFLLGFTPNPPSLPPFYFPPLLVSETGAWFCWRRGSWRGGGRISHRAGALTKRSITNPCSHWIIFDSLLSNDCWLLPALLDPLHWLVKFIFPWHILPCFPLDWLGCWPKWWRQACSSSGVGSL